MFSLPSRNLQPLAFNQRPSVPFKVECSRSLSLGSVWGPRLRAVLPFGARKSLPLLFLMSQSITIIGIDPGSRNTGWGVVREVSGVLQLVDCGVIRPPLDGEFASRLGVIFKEIHRVLGRLKPDEASVEQVFTAKNAATALKLGQARGAAIAACAAYDLPVRDYEPTVIKKSLVGVGRADKEQVSFMVGRVLGVKPDWAVDTGDALAAAICHLTHRRFERLVRLSGR